MKRQRFSREYKLEAVKQVRERGVSSARVARDLVPWQCQTIELVR